MSIGFTVIDGVSRIFVTNETARENRLSYDISLKDPVTCETLELASEHMVRGGTYAVGGTRELWLNITYNYGRWYRREEAFGKEGIRTIYGLTGAESIPVLQRAIDALTALEEDLPAEELKELEDQGVTGYWLPTRENAIRPLHQLLAFARLRPDGVWDGD